MSSSCTGVGYSSVQIPGAERQSSSPVLGTRVFKSQEPRDSRVDEALVVWSIEGEKSLHSSTPSSLVRTAIALGSRCEMTEYRKWRPRNRTYYAVPKWIQKAPNITTPLNRTYAVQEWIRESPNIRPNNYRI